MSELFTELKLISNYGPQRRGRSASSKKSNPSKKRPPPPELVNAGKQCFGGKKDPLLDVYCFSEESENISVNMNQEYAISIGSSTHKSRVTITSSVKRVPYHSVVVKSDIADDDPDEDDEPMFEMEVEEVIGNRVDTDVDCESEFSASTELTIDDGETLEPMLGSLAEWTFRDRVNLYYNSSNKYEKYLEGLSSQQLENLNELEKKEMHLPAYDSIDVDVQIRSKSPSRLTGRRSPFHRSPSRNVLVSMSEHSDPARSAEKKKKKSSKHKDDDNTSSNSSRASRKSKKQSKHEPKHDGSTSSGKKRTPKKEPNIIKTQPSEQPEEGQLQTGEKHCKSSKSISSSGSSSVNSKKGPRKKKKKKEKREEKSLSEADATSVCREMTTQTETSYDPASFVETVKFCPSRLYNSFKKGKSDKKDTSTFDDLLESGDEIGSTLSSGGGILRNRRNSGDSEGSSVQSVTLSEPQFKVPFPVSDLSASRLVTRKKPGLVSGSLASPIKTKALIDEVVGENDNSGKDVQKARTKLSFGGDATEMVDEHGRVDLNISFSEKREISPQINNYDDEVGLLNIEQTPSVRSTSLHKSQPLTISELNMRSLRDGSGHLASEKPSHLDFTTPLGRKSIHVDRNTLMDTTEVNKVRKVEDTDRRDNSVGENNTETPPSQPTHISDNINAIIETLEDRNDYRNKRKAVDARISANPDQDSNVPIADHNDTGTCGAATDKIVAPVVRNRKKAKSVTFTDESSECDRISTTTTIKQVLYGSEMDAGTEKHSESEISDLNTDFADEDLEDAESRNNDEKPQIKKKRGRKRKDPCLSEIESSLENFQKNIRHIRLRVRGEDKKVAKKLELEKSKDKKKPSGSVADKMKDKNKDLEQLESDDNDSTRKSRRSIVKGPTSVSYMDYAIQAPVTRSHRSNAFTVFLYNDGEVDFDVTTPERASQTVVMYNKTGHHCDIVDDNDNESRARSKARSKISSKATSISGDASTHHRSKMDTRSTRSKSKSVCGKKSRSKAAQKITTKEKKSSKTTKSVCSTRSKAQSISKSEANKKNSNKKKTSSPKSVAYSKVSKATCHSRKSRKSTRGVVNNGRSASPVLSLTSTTYTMGRTRSQTRAAEDEVRRDTIADAKKYLKGLEAEDKKKKNERGKGGNSRRKSAESPRSGRGRNKNTVISMVVGKMREKKEKKKATNRKTSNMDTKTRLNRRAQSPESVTSEPPYETPLHSSYIAGETPFFSPKYNKRTVKPGDMTKKAPKYSFGGRPNGRDDPGKSATPSPNIASYPSNGRNNNKSVAVVYNKKSNLKKSSERSQVEVNRIEEVRMSNSGGKKTAVSMVDVIGKKLFKAWDKKNNTAVVMKHWADKKKELSFNNGNIGNDKDNDAKSSASRKSKSKTKHLSKTQNTNSKRNKNEKEKTDMIISDSEDVIDLSSEHSDTASVLDQITTKYPESIRQSYDIDMKDKKRKDEVEEDSRSYVSNRSTSSRKGKKPRQLNALMIEIPPNDLHVEQVMNPQHLNRVEESHGSIVKYTDKANLNTESHTGRATKKNVSSAVKEAITSYCGAVVSTSEDDDVPQIEINKRSNRIISTSEDDDVQQPQINKRSNRVVSTSEDDDVQQPQINKRSNRVVSTSEDDDVQQPQINKGYNRFVSTSKDVDLHQPQINKGSNRFVSTSKDVDLHQIELNKGSKRVYHENNKQPSPIVGTGRKRTAINSNNTDFIDMNSSSSKIKQLLLKQRELSKLTSSFAISQQISPRLANYASGLNLDTCKRECCYRERIMNLFEKQHELVRRCYYDVIGDGCYDSKLMAAFPVLALKKVEVSDYVNARKRKRSMTKQQQQKRKGMKYKDDSAIAVNGDKHGLSRKHPFIQEKMAKHKIPSINLHYQHLNKTKHRAESSDDEDYGELPELTIAATRIRKKKWSTNPDYVYTMPRKLPRTISASPSIPILTKEVDSSLYCQGNNNTERLNHTTTDISSHIKGGDHPPPLTHASNGEISNGDILHSMINKSTVKNSGKGNHSKGDIYENVNTLKKYDNKCGNSGMNINNKCDTIISSSEYLGDNFSEDKTDVDFEDGMIMSDDALNEEEGGFLGSSDKTVQGKGATTITTTLKSANFQSDNESVISSDAETVLFENHQGKNTSKKDDLQHSQETNIKMPPSIYSSGESMVITSPEYSTSPSDKKGNKKRRLDTNGSGGGNIPGDLKKRKKYKSAKRNNNNNINVVLKEPKLVVDSSKSSSASSSAGALSPNRDTTSGVSTVMKSFLPLPFAEPRMVGTSSAFNITAPSFLTVPSKSEQFSFSSASRAPKLMMSRGPDNFDFGSVGQNLAPPKLVKNSSENGCGNSNIGKKQKTIIQGAHASVLFVENQPDFTTTKVSKQKVTDQAVVNDNKLTEAEPTKRKRKRISKAKVAGKSSAKNKLLYDSSACDNSSNEEENSDMDTLHDNVQVFQSSCSDRVMFENSVKNAEDNNSSTNSEISKEHVEDTAFSASSSSYEKNRKKKDKNLNNVIVNSDEKSVFKQPSNSNKYCRKNHHGAKTYNGELILKEVKIQLKNVHKVRETEEYDIFFKDNKTAKLYSKSRNIKEPCLLTPSRSVDDIEDISKLSEKQNIKGPCLLTPSRSVDDTEDISKLSENLAMHTTLNDSPQDKWNQVALKNPRGLTKAPSENHSVSSKFLDLSSDSEYESEHENPVIELHILDKAVSPKLGLLSPSSCNSKGALSNPFATKGWSGDQLSHGESQGDTSKGVNGKVREKRFTKTRPKTTGHSKDVDTESETELEQVLSIKTGRNTSDKFIHEGNDVETGGSNNNHLEVCSQSSSVTSGIGSELMSVCSPTKSYCSTASNPYGIVVSGSYSLTQENTQIFTNTNDDINDSKMKPSVIINNENSNVVSDNTASYLISNHPPALTINDSKQTIDLTEGEEKHSIVNPELHTYDSNGDTSGDEIDSDKYYNRTMQKSDSRVYAFNCIKKTKRGFECIACVELDNKKAQGGTVNQDIVSMLQHVVMRHCRCKTCHLTFPEVYAVQGHIWASHCDDDDITDYAYKLNVKANKSLYTSPPLLKECIRHSSTEGTFVCRICDKKYIMKAEVKKHVGTVHLNKIHFAVKAAELKKKKQQAGGGVKAGK